MSNLDSHNDITVVNGTYTFKKACDYIRHRNNKPTIGSIRWRYVNTNKEVVIGVIK